MRPLENMAGINPHFWKNRKVLVTGATGILGSWLIKDLLAVSAKVTALIYDAPDHCELFRSQDIKSITAVNGALEDLKTLSRTIQKFEIDTVFHLGAQTIVEKAYENPLSTFEANIRGTYNLLEACRMNKSQVHHIIVASSDKAYGTQPRLPYREDMSLSGRFPYEVSKSCADLLAQSYFHSYRLPVAIIRCGNIYGGGDLNWNRIVPGTIRSFLCNQRPIIRSDGTYVRDYIFVKDVSNAYLLIAQQMKEKKFWGEAFNVGLEIPLSVSQVVKEIRVILNCRDLKPRILNCLKGEIHSQYLSTAKIRKWTNWKPHYTLKQGLTQTIRWYHDFLA